jgi:hypothetical protein
MACTDDTGRNPSTTYLNWAPPSLFPLIVTDQTPEELLAASKRRLQVSDHFLTQTYQYVKDAKLLINILEGILKAVEDMVDAVLIRERATGTIPAYNDKSFAAKLAVLKSDPIVKKYDLGHIDIMMVSEMQELLHSHRDSMMEFQRKGALIMANDDYRLQSVTVDKIKTYLTRTKTLHTKIHDVFTRNTSVPA